MFARRPRVAERGRKCEGDDGGSHEPELDEQRAAVEPRSVRACDLGHSVHEEEIRDTLPASEPSTTTGRFAPTAKSATISSGALPKLALRKPPMPGPVCSAACSVASPISQASGIERDCREHEERDVAGSGEPVDRDRDRREEERRPKQLPNHRAAKERLRGQEEACA